MIIFPTLTDAFSSTVNLSVRQKVLTAQLKMLSNLGEDILAEALIPVPYASFLASILSQRDHPSLVMLGLQATELLLSRLDNIYRYQLYREGVIHEINKLAAEEEPADSTHDAANEDGEKQAKRSASGDDAASHHESNGDEEGEENDNDDGDGHDTSADENEDEDEDDENDDDENVDNEHEPIPGDMSPVSSRGSTMSLDMPPHRYASDMRSMKARIRGVAKKFLETHEGQGHGQAMKAKAIAILNTLSDLAGELEAFYLNRTSASLAPHKGKGALL